MAKETGVQNQTGEAALAEILKKASAYYRPTTSQIQAISLKARLFRRLSDASRLLILAALRGSPLTVRDIVVTTGLRQTNVSNCLRCLRGRGLVAFRQHGRHMRSELSYPQVAAMLRLADEALANMAVPAL